MATPTITHIEWGTVHVKHNSVTKVYKDVIIEPTRCYEWNFKENFDPECDEKYTSHQHKKDMTKGIQPHSVRHLLDSGTIFVLTTGFHSDLGVNENTIKFLTDNKKQVIIVNSKDAMVVYNELVKNNKKKVVALIHSTC